MQFRKISWRQGSIFSFINFFSWLKESGEKGFKTCWSIRCIVFAPKKCQPTTSPKLHLQEFLVFNERASPHPLLATASSFCWAHLASPWPSFFNFPSGRNLYFPLKSKLTVVSHCFFHNVYLKGRAPLQQPDKGHKEADCKEEASWECVKYNYGRG